MSSSIRLARSVRACFTKRSARCSVVLATTKSAPQQHRRAARRTFHASAARHNVALENTMRRCKEKNVIIPTFDQLKNPEKIPQFVKDKLKTIGLWDVHPANLFRITWKNEPVEKGGLFNEGNWVEFPKELTGVNARIIGICGKYFPTGAHKVGAGFGCLVPRLVTGQFDPVRQRAVWPSTGNYCRGGAFDCALLGCDAIAILPEGMSQERFDWLEDIGTKEVFKTPGSESNVKEIYDKCHELTRDRGEDVLILNQFAEFGNPVFHFHMTGGIIEQIFNTLRQQHKTARMSGYVSATGSGGTIAAGDYIKTWAPNCKVVAVEAEQCPTLYANGYGAHRIEGIGDKHVPWIHNVRNTDAVSAIDDELAVSMFRLFNDPQGKQVLVDQGVPVETVEKLNLLGISCTCNLAAAIKQAKYFEMTQDDVIFLPLTDSADMYGSRLEEMNQEKAYDRDTALRNWERLQSTGHDWFKELSYRDRKALHNLKYFTWVEQQGKSVEELNELWEPEFWDRMFAQIHEWDAQIVAFNERVGLKGYADN